MALNAEMQIVTLGDTDTVQAGIVAAVVIVCSVFADRVHPV